MMASRSLICLLENQNGGKLQKKKIKTRKENFTKICNQVTSASGQLECLTVL
jgi:hypothetical protein